MRSFFLGITLILLSSLSIQAKVIFADNFQDGNANGWQAVGKGDVRLSTYQKNISLYLSQSVSVITDFSTKGYEGISVSLSLAAKSLKKGEYCLGEVSGDGGQSWHQVNKIGNGQDDAVTLHVGTVSSGDLDNRDKVYLRVRIAANQSNDSCWLDNVRVTARKIRAVPAKNSLFPATLSRAGKSFTHPVDMSSFAPSKRATPPTYHFEGRLSFNGKIKSGGFKILKNSYGYNVSKVGNLPAFSYQFISSGEDIIPRRRGIILTDHPQWDLILEPGKIWNEPGQTTFSRAAIPFSLQEKNANCTHNGVMTFRFDNTGMRSDVAFQIGSETCLYYKFDLWGYLAATYSPGPVERDEKIIRAYRKEKSSRLPVKPISALATDYPGINPANFGSVREVDPDHITAFGVIVGGVHYVGGCKTRYGTYPYCDVLDLPSYSTAKSLFAGLALMRMEKLYPGLKNEKIADYIPACRKSGGWGDVTFLDALNMTTGHYNTDKYMVDEAGKEMIRFFDALSHKDKIKIACSSFKRQGRPGKKWVYHTSDSYILGTALQNYLTKKQGIQADIYQDIFVNGLWKKWGLSPVLKTTRRTTDNRKQAFTGYGLTYHSDDVARLATLLNSDKIASSKLFDPVEFNKAMQRDSTDRGLPAHGPDIRYKDGFWAKNFQKILGCNTPLWIPFMSGYGGITIALLPHDMTYYYFSDNNNFAWKKAVLEINKITNLCQ